MDVSCPSRTVHLGCIQLHPAPVCPIVRKFLKRCPLSLGGFPGLEACPNWGPKVALSSDVTDISSKGLLPQLTDVLHALTDSHELLLCKVRSVRLEHMSTVPLVLEESPDAQFLVLDFVDSRPPALVDTKTGTRNDVRPAFAIDRSKRYGTKLARDLRFRSERMLRSRVCRNHPSEETGIIVHISVHIDRDCHTPSQHGRWRSCPGTDSARRAHDRAR